METTRGQIIDPDDWHISQLRCSVEAVECMEVEEGRLDCGNWRALEKYNLRCDQDKQQNFTKATTLILRWAFFRPAQILAWKLPLEEEEMLP